LKVDVDGAQLNVEITGTGTPLILIHGIGANLSLWKDIVPRLSTRHKVISYDLRGSGSSDFTTDPPLSLSLWSKDVAGMMDALKIGRATLVGWSLGGIISIQFALDFPQRAKSLVLVGASTKLRQSAVNLYEERAKLAESVGMDELLKNTSHITEEAFAPSVRKDHPEKVRAFLEMIQKNRKERYAATARALVKTDLTDKLGLVTAPTLIVVGQYDVRTPIEDSELMCMKMPNALMKIIPDCGHFYPLEQPERLGNVISTYLATSSH
jgi:pimeloyl-ACP methyl ester carboxylesterase